MNVFQRPAATFRMHMRNILAVLFLIFGLITSIHQAHAMSTCLSEQCTCSGTRACVVWITGAGIYAEKNLKDRLNIDLIKHKVGNNRVGYIDNEEADIIVLRPTGSKSVLLAGYVYYYTDEDRKVFVNFAKQNAKLGHDLHVMVSSAGVSEFKNKLKRRAG